MAAAFEILGEAGDRRDPPTRGERRAPLESHAGLPMLLRGGLLSFERDVELDGWTYVLEFRGSRP